MIHFSIQRALVLGAAFLAFAPQSAQAPSLPSKGNVASFAAGAASLALLSVAFYVRSTILEKRDSTSFIKNSDIPDDIKEIIFQQTRGWFNLSAPKYLEVIKQFPWIKTPPYNPSVADAEAILNESHYGLSKVKQNIINMLAGQQVMHSNKGKVLCLVGPAGTGKTTMAASIAKALGRDFYSLPSNLADYRLRGEKAGYANSEAGLFTQALCKTGKTNPVIFIDEIDKATVNSLSSLLDAFDPEKNTYYQDNFLGFGVDLSDVFFITTANSTRHFPTPLKNRLEIINIAPYTREEKIEIAQQFSIPKLTKETQLPAETVAEISNIVPALVDLVSRSSEDNDGIRSLQAALKSLISKQIAEILLRGKPITITPENLEQHVDCFFSEVHLNTGKDTHEYCEQLLKKARIPADIFKIVEQKIGELRAWKSSSSLIKNYVEWVVKYPFKKYTPTHATLSDAITQLNKTHCGVTDVKETIIDHLAGLHTSTTEQQKILCLCGGPGIGKTTIAESIAAALGKKFTKISFGALTSLSSSKSISENASNAPGPIAKALIKAGTLNPVILLDELEKAPEKLIPELLELLDPSQNKAFKDTYLDFELDLSKVTFIASVNDVKSLPSPLRDRMQIIKMHPYSIKERIEIGTTKLVPEISKDFNFSAELQEKLQSLVQPLVERIAPLEYGVRTLKRALIIAAEKYARQFLIQKETGNAAEITTIPATEILAAMNPEILQNDPATTLNAKDCVGIANGMCEGGANGGGLLKIEVIVNPNGKGTLASNSLHGKMSCEAEKRVFAYVRSVAQAYNIKPEVFSTSDFIFGDQHYQAVDGPSAGIAQTTALISALTNRTVKQNFAVTGAIDMHGNVLPVGGYRNKILGSEQSGIKNIIVPECARPTIEALRKDFPTLNIFYVSTVPQALELLLNPAN